MCTFSSICCCTDPTHYNVQLNTHKRWEQVADRIGLQLQDKPNLPITNFVAQLRITELADLYSAVLLPLKKDLKVHPYARIFYFKEFSLTPHTLQCFTP